MYSMEENFIKGSDASSETVVSVQKPAQSFEWITHGDVSARKRARAHVTRGFRREWAAQAGKGSKKREKERRDALDQSCSRPPQEDLDSSELGQTTTAVTSLVANKVQPHEHIVDIAREEFSALLSSKLILRQSLGSGRNDPFSSLPIEMDHRANTLINHFLSGVAPVSFRQDNRANFQPVKDLAFRMSLSGPSAFHVILATAANDIAVLHGREESADGMIHNGLALQLVNKRLLQEADDASLATVALLAGNELLTGTPQGFNTHMKGLKSLMKARGSLESFQEESPQFFAVLSWFDYSGSCNLLSRRRFDPGVSDSEILYSRTSGVPDIILKGLPAGYDLYQTLADTFKGLLTFTTIWRVGGCDATRISQSAAVAAEFDSALHQSILLPKQKGVRSRRRHIQQSLNILALIYTTLAANHFQSNGMSTDTFMTRFKTAVVDENVEWGLTIAKFFRYLLEGDDLDQKEFSAQVSLFYDVSADLGWLSWKNVKEALFDFFVYDSACEGCLQVVWQKRMPIVSTQ